MDYEKHYWVEDSNNYRWKCICGWKGYALKFGYCFDGNCPKCNRPNSSGNIEDVFNYKNIPAERYW